jgi:hypothetical protein
MAEASRYWIFSGAAALAALAAVELEGRAAVAELAARDARNWRRFMVRQG